MAVASAPIRRLSPDGNHEADVVRRCREGIDRADHVFAWVDDPAAYGTLYEIGLTVGLGRKTWLHTSAEQDHDDLWFANHSATHRITAGLRPRQPQPLTRRRRGCRFRRVSGSVQRFG
jgi:nucleoside 2-deoxyribosyltransferase